MPLSAFSQSTNPLTLPQLYAQYPAGPLTGGEIVAMQQGANTVGGLTSQFAAYIGSNIFAPGCALSGTWNSQIVNLGSGSGCVTGLLPLANLAIGSPSPLSLATAGIIPQWFHVGYAISYTAFSTAATTNSIALFILPANGIIHGIRIKQSTAFAGTSITAYTISVGDSGSAVRYASPFNVYQSTGTGTYKLSSNLGGEDTVSPTTVYVTATSTGANLSAGTAGVVDIYAMVSVIE